MTENEFKESFQKELTKKEKIQVLQHFIDNYPVEIKNLKNMRAYDTNINTWTKLQNIIITDGSDELVNQSFNKLKEHYGK